MTSETLKLFLIGHASGISDTSKAQVADIAMESGYAAVWGRYPWTIRRATANVATVASQAYSVLPADFESVRSILYQGTSRYHRINFKDEAQFDEDFPKPSLVTGVPQFAKLVYNGPNAADRYRVYWYPVPDAVYSLPMAYNKQSDLNFLSNLPVWLVNAVVHKSLVLMQPTVDKRYNADAIAEATIQAAIASDNPLNTNDPTFGSDPGFDDFSLNSGAGSLKDGTWP